MCVLVHISVFVCGNSGPLISQQHTGPVFMTDCNSKVLCGWPTSFELFFQCCVAVVEAPGACTDTAVGCLFYLCWRFLDVECNHFKGRGHLWMWVSVCIHLKEKNRSSLSVDAATLDVILCVCVRAHTLQDPWRCVLIWINNKTPEGHRRRDTLLLVWPLRRTNIHTLSHLVSDCVRTQLASLYTQLVLSVLTISPH